MIISKETVDKVLAVYKPEQRLLLSAEIGYPIFRGNFLIGDCYYLINPGIIKHATDIEIQLCLNQLAYVGFAELINSNILPELGNQNFFQLQGENMLIVESRKRFRRRIPTDKEISGEMQIKNSIQKGKTIFFWTDFQFENRSCLGNLELAVVLP